jgi:hypothetical protein
MKCWKRAAPHYLIVSIPGYSQPTVPNLSLEIQLSFPLLLSIVVLGFYFRTFFAYNSGKFFKIVTVLLIRGTRGSVVG